MRNPFALLSVSDLPSLNLTMRAEAWALRITSKKGAQFLCLASKARQAQVICGVRRVTRPRGRPPYLLLFLVQPVDIIVHRQ